tara:strand:+ start:488 stop:694 length:207 start_codon:yes stop_codon:yes gene_type:complete
MMTYDEMVLRGPEEAHEIGTEHGDECGRYEEPDEDAPRGYRAKPCTGTMKHDESEGMTFCTTCWEMVG